MGVDARIPGEQEALEASLAELIRQCLTVLVPHMTTITDTHLVFQLALHRPNWESFFLLSSRGGPYLAVGAVDDAADALVEKLWPGGVSPHPYDGAVWAGRQDWQVIVTLHLRRAGMYSWESYDPREEN